MFRFGFCLFLFCYFTSGYSHFSSTGIESGARLALEARHKTLSTHKHVQHSTQVQAQSASMLWAVLHISLLHSSFPSPESFLGYFNRTSFGFLVSGSLLHVTTYSRSVGRNSVLDRFFHFIVPIFLAFPLWHEITPILSIPR